MMQEMISKELLEAVLELNRIKEFECRDNECYIINKDNTPPIGNAHILINIYEFAHKCKEWLLNEYDYSLSTKYISSDEGIYVISTITHFRGDGTLIIYSDVDSTTEVEAVFKACQFILNVDDILKGSDVTK